jgi:hypothetical protein
LDLRRPNLDLPGGLKCVKHAVERHNVPITNRLSNYYLGPGGRLYSWIRRYARRPEGAAHFAICTKSCTKTKLSLLEMVLSGMLLLTNRGSAKQLPFFVCLPGTTWVYGHCRLSGFQNG